MSVPVRVRGRKGLKSAELESTAFLQVTAHQQSKSPFRAPLSTCPFRLRNQPVVGSPLCGLVAREEVSEALLDLLKKDLIQPESRLMMRTEGGPLKTFTPEQHREALTRRRVKFVVEKGSMAQLFRAGTNAALQKDLLRLLQPSAITKLQTRDEYDEWLIKTFQMRCWERYSRNGLENDRWAYFAKLINIVVYEIVANRELCSDSDWARIRPFLHLPIDVNVLLELERLDANFPKFCG